MEAIAKLKKYTAHLDKEGFISGDMAADAVVRNLEIIGEAANRIPEEFRARHPEIESLKLILTGVKLPRPSAEAQLSLSSSFGLRQQGQSPCPFPQVECDELSSLEPERACFV